jgi:hypothetical protein
MTPGKQQKSRRSTLGKKGRDALDFRPSPSSAINWLKRLDKGRLQIIPTTKVTEIIDRIRGWKKEHPREKVTIFTQWNHLAIMIGVLLQKEKLKFVYITVTLMKISYAYPFR